METETITRACGHTAAFVPAGDAFDEARRTKLRTKRCAECGRAKNEADNLAALQSGKSRLKKGSEVKALPPGAILTLGRNGGGRWDGFLTAEGVTVSADANGLMSVVNKLARKWLAATGAKLQGKVAL